MKSALKFLIAAAFFLFVSPLLAVTNVFAEPIIFSEGMVGVPPFLSKLFQNGIYCTHIDKAFAERFGTPVSEGLLVVPMQPAQASAPQAGSFLLPWDIIVKCNGKPVPNTTCLFEIAQNARMLNFTVFRSGQYMELSVLNEAEESEKDSRVGRKH